jgi:hypothetical protein
VPRGEIQKSNRFRFGRDERVAIFAAPRGARRAQWIRALP